MIEWLWLWLGLPIALYALLRILRSEDELGRSISLSTALDFASESTPQWIEPMLDAQVLNAELVERYILLGQWLRQRGEPGTALLLHQQLGQRSAQAKAQLHIELARDWIELGQLEHAVQLLLPLAQARHDSWQLSALEELCQIYEQQQQWQSAARCCVLIARHGGRRDLLVNAAQYCCEQAQAEMRSNRNEQATALLRQALSYDPHCARALLYLAEGYLQRGDYNAAADQLFRLYQQAPNFFSETFSMLERCYVGRIPQLLERLLAIHRSCPSAPLSCFIAEHLLALQGEARSQQFLLDAFEHRPTWLVLRALLQRPAPSTVPFENQLAVLLDVETDYCCQRCGLRTRTLFWQCPGCHNWGSLHPVSDFTLHAQSRPS